MLRYCTNCKQTGEKKKVSFLLGPFGHANIAIHVYPDLSLVSDTSVFLATRPLAHPSPQLCSRTIIPHRHLPTGDKNRTCMAFFFADFQQSSMQILCKCFSVPRLSDFLAFRLLLFCKCRGLQKTEGAEDL